jgi:hypothetical protein
MSEIYISFGDLITHRTSTPSERRKFVVQNQDILHEYL